MITVILIIHIILALSIICAVLLQKSEGGGLGIGGSGPTKRIPSKIFIKFINKTIKF